MDNNIVLGGNNNSISDGRIRNSIIIGGKNHSINDTINDSVVIGGNGNKVKSQRSVVLGGAGITGTTDNDTVYVPRLNIRDVSNGTPTMNLGVDANGVVVSAATGSNSGNCISELVKAIQSNSETAAIQPKILNYFNKKMFDYAGGCGGHLDIYCFPFARGRLFLNQEIDSGQYDNKEECFWASGTCIMVRRNLFFESGGFEKIFFAHMEEIDLCWKLIAMGYKVKVIPTSIVYHKNALTLPMFSHKKYYLNHRNSLLMLFGNYSISNIILKGSVRIILEIIASLYSIFLLDWKHFTGIIRAIIWIIFHPNEIVKKRNKFIKIKKLKDNDIIKKMYQTSIIAKYYIKNRKTYSSILSKYN